MEIATPPREPPKSLLSTLIKMRHDALKRLPGRIFHAPGFRSGLRIGLCRINCNALRSGKTETGPAFHLPKGRSVLLSVTWWEVEISTHRFRPTNDSRPKHTPPTRGSHPPTEPSPDLSLPPYAPRAGSAQSLPELPPTLAPLAWRGVRLPAAIPEVPPLRDWHTYASPLAPAGTVV